MINPIEQQQLDNSSDTPETGHRHHTSSSLTGNESYALIDIPDSETAHNSLESFHFSLVPEKPSSLKSLVELLESYQGYTERRIKLITGKPFAFISHPGKDIYILQQKIWYSVKFIDGTTYQEPSIRQLPTDPNQLDSLTTVYINPKHIVSDNRGLSISQALSPAAYEQIQVKLEQARAQLASENQSLLASRKEKEQILAHLSTLSELPSEITQAIEQSTTFEENKEVKFLCNGVELAAIINEYEQDRHLILSDGQFITKRKIHVKVTTSTEPVHVVLDVVQRGSNGYHWVEGSDILRQGYNQSPDRLSAEIGTKFPEGTKTFSAPLISAGLLPKGTEVVEMRDAVTPLGTIRVQHTVYRSPIEGSFKNDRPNQYTPPVLSADTVAFDTAKVEADCYAFGQELEAFTGLESWIIPEELPHVAAFTLTNEAIEVYTPGTEDYFGWDGADASRTRSIAAVVHLDWEVPPGKKEDGTIVTHDLSVRQFTTLYPTEMLRFQAEKERGITVKLARLMNCIPEGSLKEIKARYPQQIQAIEAIFHYYDSFATALKTFAEQNITHENSVVVIPNDQQLPPGAEVGYAIVQLSKDGKIRALRNSAVSPSEKISILSLTEVEMDELMANNENVSSLVVRVVKLGNLGVRGIVIEDVDVVWPLHMSVPLYDTRANPHPAPVAEIRSNFEQMRMPAVTEQMIKRSEELLANGDKEYTPFINPILLENILSRDTAVYFEEINTAQTAFGGRVQRAWGGVESNLRTGNNGSYWTEITVMDEPRHSITLPDELRFLVKEYFYLHLSKYWPDSASHCTHEQITILSHRIQTLRALAKIYLYIAQNPIRYHLSAQEITQLRWLSDVMSSAATSRKFVAYLLNWPENDARLAQWMAPATEQPTSTPTQPLPEQQPPSKSKWETLQELDALSAEDLKNVIATQTREDQKGRWRLAVAALSTKGYAAQLFISELALPADTIASINNALSKVMTEATSHKSPKLDAITHYVDNASNCFNEAVRLPEIKQQFLETAKNHPDFSVYIGNNDPAASEQFALKLFVAFDRKGHAANQVPDWADLELLMNEVFEEMTDS